LLLHQLWEYQKINYPLEISKIETFCGKRV
jgi:hypothetical protein